MEGPDFNLEFQPAYGQAVPVAEGVERITVNNPSPFTFHGTNSYIVGKRSVAVVIDIATIATTFQYEKSGTAH